MVHSVFFRKFGYNTDTIRLKNTDLTQKKLGYNLASITFLLLKRGASQEVKTQVNRRSDSPES